MSLFEVKFRLLWVYYSIKEYFQALFVVEDPKDCKDDYADYNRKL